MRRVKVGEVVESGGMSFEVAQILDNIEKPQFIAGHTIINGQAYKRTIKFLGQNWREPAGKGVEDALGKKMKQTKT